MTAVPTLDLILRVALIFAAAYLTIAGAIVLAFVASPRFVLAVAAGGRRARLSSLRGLAILTAAAMAVILLQRSGVVGMAVAIVGCTPLLAVWIAGYAGVALRLGRAVLDLHGPGPHSELLAVLSGHTILMTAVHVPVIGWAALAYAMFHGLGAAAGEAAGRIFATRDGAPEAGGHDLNRTTERS